jgi:hypothetical protein
MGRGAGVRIFVYSFDPIKIADSAISAGRYEKICEKYDRICDLRKNTNYFGQKSRVGLAPAYCGFSVYNL